MKYGTCDHEIEIGVEVLVSYGTDADTGTAISVHPDRYFGTVLVRMSNRTIEALAEDTLHLGCDENDWDN